MSFVRRNEKRGGARKKMENIEIGEYVRTDCYKVGGEDE